MWERRLFKHEQFQLTKDCQLPITRVLKLGNKVFNHERYPDLKELNNEPMCDPLEIFNYIYKPFNESFAGGTFSGISYWIKRLQMSSENTCRLPCEHWDFDFSEDKYREFPDDLNAGVTLTVRDVQYPYIREVPALEWVDYLALIGGAWGLCVGASFITVIQLVVYTIRFLFRSKQADKQIDAN